MHKKAHDFLLLSVTLRTTLTYLIGTSASPSKGAAFLLNETVTMACLFICELLLWKWHRKCDGRKNIQTSHLCLATKEKQEESYRGRESLSRAFNFRRQISWAVHNCSDFFQSSSRLTKAAMQHSASQIPNTNTSHQMSLTKWMQLGQVTAPWNFTGNTLLAQINTTCSIHPNGCRAAMMTTMPFGLMRTAWYHRAYLETFAAPGGPALPSALLLQQQELLVPNSWAGLTAETKMQITTIITSQCPDSKPSAVSSTLYCLQITWRGLLGY